MEKKKKDKKINVSPSSTQTRMRGAAAGQAEEPEWGGGGGGRKAMLRTTMGENGAWTRCLLSQRLEPEILHLTYNSEGEGAPGRGGFVPGQQPAEAPVLREWEWPHQTHLKPVWFGSKPDPVWPGLHGSGQNDSSTYRNSKTSRCYLWNP